MSHLHQPPAAPAATYPVAQLERRFQAFAIDRMVAWLLPLAGAAVTWLVVGDDLLPILAVAGGLLVATWLLMAVVLGAAGTSPGKSARGLRVVHHGTGTPIGVGRSLLRSLVLAGSGLPTFGIGVATLAWTAVEDRSGQRRGWHDQVARSVVVDVRPAPVVTVVAETEGPRHIVNLTAMRLIPAPAVEVPETPARTIGQSVRRQSPTVPEAMGAPQQPPQQQPNQPPTQRRGLPPAAPPAAPHPARWRVQFDQGETFLVEGPVLVGRRPEPRAGEAVSRLVPLASADMSVSKTHAQLGPAADGAIVVVDRGSTNGTTIVRQGVARQLSPGRPATLLSGDVVVFGDRRMTLSRES